MGKKAVKINRAKKYVERKGKKKKRLKRYEKLNKGR